MIAENAATSAAGGTRPPSICCNAHVPLGSSNGIEQVAKHHIGREALRQQCSLIAAQRLALVRREPVGRAVAAIAEGQGA